MPQNQHPQPRRQCRLSGQSGRSGAVRVGLLIAKSGLFGPRGLCPRSDHSGRTEPRSCRAGPDPQVTFGRDRPNLLGHRDIQPNRVSGRSQWPRSVSREGLPRSSLPTSSATGRAVRRRRGARMPSDRRGVSGSPLSLHRRTRNRSMQAGHAAFRRPRYRRERREGITWCR